MVNIKKSLQKWRICLMPTTFTIPTFRRVYESKDVDLPLLESRFAPFKHLHCPAWVSGFRQDDLAQFFDF
jgi:hypothetical protein